MLTLDRIKKPIKDIVSFGLVARVLTIFKAVLIAFFIGANYRADIYLVAFSATMIVTKVIADGVTVTLVPTLQEIDKRDGLRGRNEFTNNIVNTLILLSILLMALGLIFAPLIIKAMGPGFEGIDFTRAIKLFRLGLPIMTFHFIRAIGGGYLQSIHKFKSGAKAGIINPVIYIIYLLTFSHRFGIEGLMVAGVLAAMGQAYTLYKGCVNAGYKYEYYILLKDRTLIRVFTFLLPIMVGIGINEINAAVDNAVGSILEPGTIAQLNYANDIITLLVGIFIVAIITAIFPILAESFNKDKMDDLNQSLNFSFKMLILIAIPTTIILITLAQPIVKLFYERGEFGVANTIITANLLIYYSVGIVGTSLVLLLARIFYAIKDTNTPLILGVIALGTNIILNIILVRFIGARGIAISTSISVLITSMYGIFKLDSKLNFISWKQVFYKLLKLAVATAIMILVIFIIKSNLYIIFSNTFMGNLFFVTISSVIASAAFGSVLYLTKV